MASNKNQIMQEIIAQFNGKEYSLVRITIITRLLENHGYQRAEDFLGYRVYTDEEYRVYVTASQGGHIHTHMEVC